MLSRAHQKVAPNALLCGGCSLCRLEAQGVTHGVVNHVAVVGQMLSFLPTKCDPPPRCRHNDMQVHRCSRTGQCHLCGTHLCHTKEWHQGQTHSKWHDWRSSHMSCASNGPTTAVPQMGKTVTLTLPRAATATITRQNQSAPKTLHWPCGQASSWLSHFKTRHSTLNLKKWTADPCTLGGPLHHSASKQIMT